MGYRTSARRDDDRPEVPEAGPLLVVSADGVPGAHGRAGASGADGTFGGDAGGPGGDAERGGFGGKAGRVVVELSAASEGIVALDGHVATRERTVHVRRSVAFERDALICLTARGGRGGAGGQGGRGGDGARGRSGSDATRYSSGSDGGPGGDGGDAGGGGDGGPGGDGGEVVVRASEHDTHLFMLVQGDVGAGRGGAAGQNGAAGRGGSGGSGGSSYSWTEIQTDTDSNGNTTTRTTSHSSSGGSTGVSGSDGRASRRRPAAGRAGTAGATWFEVRRADGVVSRYTDRYDLRLLGFSHRNESDDAIYEPGERVFIEDIAIANVGGMPLPSHHDVRVALEAGTFAVPELDDTGAPSTLVLPRGLPARERHVLPGRLSFVLAPHVPKGPSAPLAVEETLRIRAYLPAAKRTFRELDRGASEAHGKIVVRYPVEISPVEGLTSLAAGQVTKVRLRVRNVSNKAFGAASDQGRTLAVRVGLGYGELGATDVAFFHETGEPAPLGPGVLTPIPLVEAEGYVDYEAKLGICEHAPPYASARVSFVCEVTPVDGGGPRPVQIQELVVRVGRPLVASEADVLLLVNEGTTQEELAAWEGHVAAMGLRVATWDVSLEDGVAVLERIAEGTLSFRTVVVLDNPVAAREGGERTTSALVPKELALALVRRGVELLFVGGGKKLANLVVPTAPASPTVLPAGAARRTIHEAALALEVGEGEVALAVESTYVWPWSAVSRAHLDGVAASLARDLERAHPGRRFVVVPRYLPGEARKTAFVRRVPTGAIHVRRTTDGAAPQVRVAGKKAADLRAAEELRDHRVFFVLLLALPFETKLRALLGATAPCEGDDDPYVLAVLADLVAESAPWTVDTFGASALGRTGALPRLEALETEIAAAPKGAVTGARIASLVAWLGAIARARVPLWHWLPPLVWTTRRQALRRRIARLAGRVAPLVPEGALEASGRRVGALRAASVGLGFVEGALDARGAGLLTRTDADVHPRGERVMASDTFDALADKDIAHAAAARASQRSRLAAREGLLEARSTAELSRGGARVRVHPGGEEPRATAADLVSLLEPTQEPTPREAER